MYDGKGLSPVIFPECDISAGLVSKTSRDYYSTYYAVTLLFLLRGKNSYVYLLRFVLPVLNRVCVDGEEERGTGGAAKEPQDRLRPKARTYSPLVSSRRH